jgi:sodium transport system ATP-binding protein
MIQVNGLYKSFGPVAALRGVTFSAPDGRITALIGPNGAGKTTALRVLYTILRPDLGSASVDGDDTVAAALQVQRRIGALPDSHGLYPRLTARENIRYYGRLHSQSRDLIAPLGTTRNRARQAGEALERNIEALIKLLDMQDIADRRAEGFSQGQRVKTAIARALVHQPQNILLDEPTGGLDVLSTRAMRAFIRRLRDEGRCVLFSSHIMQEVSTLCDNIVVLARGQVVATGTPDELRQMSHQANLEDALVTVIGSEEGLER